MNRVAKTVVAAALTLTLLGGVVGISMAADPPPPSKPQGPERQLGQGNRFGMGQGAGIGSQMLSDSVADALGMTAEQIHAERLAGKSLADIAATKGVSEDKLVELMLAGRKTLLDQRVAAGTLTQAQADAAIAEMQTRVKEGINRIEIGPNRSVDGLGLGLRCGRTDQTGVGARQPGQGTALGTGGRWGMRGR